MRKTKAVLATMCLALATLGAATACLGQTAPAQQAWPSYTNSIGIEFVLIPAGTVLVETGKNMFGEPVYGSTAVVTQPFYLGKYEVTQEQWAKVMGDNPAVFKGRHNPVENVSWLQVQDFISKLNDLEGHSAYRLPTDMEWELAARGEARGRYFFGDPETGLDAYAWFADNAGGKTHPVGEKLPNAYGLYDIYGNVRELTNDWFAAYPEQPQLVDYQGPASGSGHVNQGGGWSSSLDDFSQAYRTEVGPNGQSDSLGFRLAMPLFDLDTYTDPLGIEFVLIPAGSFMIGNDTRAVVTKPFYIGKYELTQDQWVAVMGSDPSYYEGENLPVDSVSYDDVQEFLTALNAKMGHNRYRLPTEHEWELAARGGTSTSYFFGDPQFLDDYAWFRENASLATHPVGSKLPNPYGLYDVYGNLWEWVQDWYAPYPDVDELVDFLGAESGTRRVNKGGSWNNAPGFNRSDARSSYTYGNRVTGIGFRLVLEVE